MLHLTCPGWRSVQSVGLLRAVNHIILSPPDSLWAIQIISWEYIVSAQCSKWSPAVTVLHTVCVVLLWEAAHIQLVQMQKKLNESFIFDPNLLPNLQLIDDKINTFTGIYHRENSASNIDSTFIWQKTKVMMRPKCTCWVSCLNEWRLKCQGSDV